MERFYAMNAIKVKIAGHVGEICSAHRFSRKMYRDFRIDEPAEYRITLTDEDIEFSFIQELVEPIACVKAPQILEKMALALLPFETILMHGAVVAVNDLCYMFTAPGGTGKSTHVKTWLERCSQAYIVNGDKPFIKFSNDETPPLACGSPWAGKENQYTNTMVPLKSIILMERAEDNRMEQITFAQAFPTLLQQVYRPDDEENMRRTLKLMQRLPPAVSFWRFHFNNFKDDCFDVAYNALVRGQL